MNQAFQVASCPVATGMTTKDVYVLIVSIATLLFSVASFIFTMMQRWNENERSTRKTLTDGISELTKVNLAFAQLEIDHLGKQDDDRIVNFRRQVVMIDA